MLCAEVTREDDGYLLTTVLLRITMEAWMALDWEKGCATLYLTDGQLPDTALAAATGRRLGDIVATGHADHLLVTGARLAEMKEMRSVTNRITGDGIAIETGLPGWVEARFETIYRRA